MSNIYLETSKMLAINFATWLEDNSWAAVRSNKLGKTAYIDCSKHNVYVHASYEYLTKLVQEHGKTLEELCDMFVEEEKQRISNEK